MNGCMERICHSKPIPEDNDIACGKADEDGIILKENITGTGIYIYFSEIDNVCQQMKKLRFEHYKTYSEDSVKAKELQDCNTSKFKNLSSLEGYYKSDEWKLKRLNRLRIDGFRCVNCGSPVGLEVHHLDYGRVGGEDVKGDLRTLCGRCHKEVTVNVRRGRA